MDRTASPLVRQVARARRRLLAQRLLAALAWSWTAALLLGAGWFVLRPHAFPAAPPALLWAVPAALVGAATLAAAAFVWARRPSPLAAALELDGRFGLRERATTGLTLSGRDAASPAGRALLDDADRRVAPLRVADRFPVRPTRAAALVPLSAAAMLLVAFLYDPQPAAADEAPSEKRPLAVDPARAAEIEQKKKLLQRQPDKAKQPEDADPKLDKLLDDVDKLANKPTGSREEAQDAVKEFGKVEDGLRDREKELGERADALKQQLQEEARLGKKKKPEGGPGDRLDKAVGQGDLKQAEDELKRLVRRLDPEQQKQADRRAAEAAQRLQAEGLAEEEKEQLNRELADLKELQPLNDKDREQLEGQLRDLKEQAECLARAEPEDGDKVGDEGRQELKELAEKLGEAGDCLKGGKDGEAARKMAEAARKMGKLDGGQERQKLAAEAAKVALARKALCQALDGGGPAAGRRPEAPGADGGARPQRARSDVDARGQLRIENLVRGDGMKGPRRLAEMQEEIRQAAQDAPEALDRQRLPRSATDMARGYFEKLRAPEKGK